MKGWIILDLAATSSLLRLLSDPTRVRLLALLEREELTVAELSAVLHLAQPRVSTHLAKLKEADLVRDRGMGYAFHREEPAAIAATLRQLASSPATAARLGENAMAFSRREGRLEHAVAAWDRLLREAAC